MATTSTPSVFDVLDHFEWTYKPNRFSDPEIAAELVEAVTEHYTTWRARSRGEDEIRLMTGLRPFRSGRRRARGVGVYD